jgi:hypothetical protein
MFALMTNGTPICTASDREAAARKFADHYRCIVTVGEIFQVDELSPRDQSPDLCEALTAGRLFGLAC